MMEVREIIVLNLNKLNIAQENVSVIKIHLKEKDESVFLSLYGSY